VRYKAEGRRLSGPRGSGSYQEHAETDGEAGEGATATNRNGGASAGGDEEDFNSGDS
jgi:hypothetical protein